MEQKILGWELYFLVFGLFHLHRIWGLIDRNLYADFWIGVMVWCEFYALESCMVVFILLGSFAFCLGVKLPVQRNRTI
nr:hypothetical protein [uncultured Acetatifactor sp.]